MTVACAKCNEEPAQFHVWPAWPGPGSKYHRLGECDLITDPRFAEYVRSCLLCVVCTATEDLAGEGPFEKSYP